MFRERRDDSETQERDGDGGKGGDGDAGDAGGDEAGRSVYVAKLNFRTTTPDLEEAFSKFGKVTCL